VQINAHSSRSHCLLIINVTGTNTASGVRTVGKLTLCDLAGSERINKTGATGMITCDTRSSFAVS
jgi:kinesin family protein C2/C3